jgi:hypothetical protein
LSPADESCRQITGLNLKNLAGKADMRQDQRIH